MSGERHRVLEPMLARAATELPTDGEWAFEPKYDGIRVLAFAAGDSVALVTRNGNNKAASFPEVAEALRLFRSATGRDLVLDGELVALAPAGARFDAARRRNGTNGTTKGRGRNGRHADGEHAFVPLRFQALQSRMHVSERGTIAHHAEAAPAAFVAFDVLVDGDDSLVSEPWTKRRARLERIFALAGRRARPNGSRGRVVLGESVRGVPEREGVALLERARANGWEGVIAKRVSGVYEPGRRSGAWLKLKVERRQEFVVGGYTEPRNSREHLGALLLGYYDDDGGLVYAGHAGGGFSRESLRAVYARLARLQRTTSPFTTVPRTNERAHWVRPELVVEVRFNEWTDDGKLRQPIFLGVRDDKDPRDVTRESSATPAVSATRASRPVRKRTPSTSAARWKAAARVPRR